MNKNIFKFIAGGAALAAVAVGVLFLANYVRWRTSPEYRAEQYFKELEKRYREDTYGGDTPEETLQLFIDALKKGDIDLASKYFVMDEQQRWNQELKEIESGGFIRKMVEEMQSAQLTIQGDVAFLTLADGKGVVRSELVMHRNPLNNRWKISEL